MELPRFDMTQIETNGCIFVIGRRDRGKTFLMQDMMCNLREKITSDGIAITLKPEGDNQVYQKFMSVENVYSDYERIKPQCFDEKQFIIFDDCFYYFCDDDNNFIPKSLIIKTANTSLSVVVMQYPLNPTNQLKRCLNYLIIFSESILTSRNRIYRLYLNKIIPTFDLFCQMMDQISGHQCLVIAVKTKQVFIYEATDRGNFTMDGVSYYIK